jgi:hypothetical protein
MKGARIFVGVIFALLAASFFASTGMMIYEFREGPWEQLLMTYSHLFVFFPTFGLLVLAGFYLPSVIFTDLYWHHATYGRVRFALGFLAAIGISLGVNALLQAPPAGIWQLSPSALILDRGEPQNCAGTRQCRRASVADALHNIRNETSQRSGLSLFARNCRPDPLIEIPDEFRRERFCFATGTKLNGAACCEAQVRMRETTWAWSNDPKQRSVLSELDLIFQPLKSFFVTVIIVMGILLALWRDRLEELYGPYIPSLERGVLIGAVAMLMWPMMDYGYQQVANAVFGRLDPGLQVRWSLVVAPWALLLSFYFMRRLGERAEMVGRLLGVAASGIAVVRYEDINDWSARLVGAGAGPVSMVAMAVVLMGGFYLLWRPRRLEVLPPDAVD